MRKANRDDNDGRSGRHDHDESDEQDGNADHGHRDAARDPVSEVDCLPDQTKLPKSLILQPAIVAFGK